MKIAKSFLNEVAINKELAEELQKAKNKEGIIHIAENYGYSLDESAFDFLKHVSQMKVEGALSEEDLAAVSGGFSFREAGRWLDETGEEIAKIAPGVWIALTSNLKF